MKKLSAVLIAAVAVAAVVAARPAPTPKPHEHLRVHGELVGDTVAGHTHHGGEEEGVELGEVLRSQLAPVYARLGGYQRGSSSNGARGELFDTGIQGAEPTLGITSDGTIYFKGLTAGVATTEWPVVASSDQGKTWTDVSHREAGNRVHATGQDPILYVDKDTDRIFDNDFLAPCSLLSFSDDAKSWTESGVCGLTDHQNIFAGPPAVSQTRGYPNVVYYCAIDGGALAAYGTMTSCAKSLDGGVVWTKTLTPAFTDEPGSQNRPGMSGIPGHCGGATGHGFVDRKGTVYLPRGYCGEAWLAISKDEGDSWKRVQVARNGFPQTANGSLHEHEAGVAVDRRGNIYYFYMARDRLPYLVTSKNGGKSWSKPVMVAPHGVKETALPTIDISSKGIALAYVGSTNAPGGQAPDGEGDEYGRDTAWHGYITVTTNPLAKNPRFTTVTVNDPKDPLQYGSCGIVRCGAQYDFIDVVIAPDGTPWAAYIDACDPQGICVPRGKGVVGHMRGGPNLGRW